MQITRFQHRTKLGIRYVREYLLDEVSEGYGRSYLPSKPLDVICEISYVCNLECPTCFRWTAKPDEHELTADQWKTALTRLKQWLGTFNLTFTGGEPFLRKDILEIFRFAADNGIVTGVVSNGSLIDKELARKIVASGLDGLTLSLNSMVPEIHNKTRGTNGAFNEVMRAIDNMQDRRGHFYYRKYPMATAKTPMLHWGQATMYKALSTLLFRLDAAREQPTSAGLGRR